MSFASYVLAQEEGKKPMLYRLPSYASFDVGDELLVESGNGKARATVMDSAYLDDDGIRVVKKIIGVSGDLPKVLARAFYSEFDWEIGKYEEGGSDSVGA